MEYSTYTSVPDPVLLLHSIPSATCMGSPIQNPQRHLQVLRTISSSRTCEFDSLYQALPNTSREEGATPALRLVVPQSVILPLSPSGERHS